MHPLNSRQLAKNMENAFSTDLPDGLSKLQTSLELNQTFSVVLSKYLSVQTYVRMSGFGYNDGEHSNPFSTEIIAASAHANLDVRECVDGIRREGQGSDLFEYEKVNLHIPEWTRHVTGRDVDVHAVTVQLAFTGEAEEYAFPGPDITYSDGMTAQLRAENEHAFDAVGWLLERFEDGRTLVDLDRVRIEAGGDIYDGHGRLVAFKMYASMDDLKGFIETRGEDALREAFKFGILFGNGASALAGKRIAQPRVDLICDVLTGRENKPSNLRFGVAWERHMFEEAIRPQLSSAPFARSPRTIESKPAGIYMLEAFMDRHDRIMSKVNKLR